MISYRVLEERKQVPEVVDLGSSRNGAKGEKVTKLSDVMWKESIDEAAIKLADALIEKFYEPNEDGPVTRDRVIKLMGDPFGLEWENGSWRPRTTP